MRAVEERGSLLRLVMAGETADDFDPAVLRSRELVTSWKLSARSLAECILSWGGDPYDERERRIHQHSAYVAESEFPSRSFAVLQEQEGELSLPGDKTLDARSVYYAYTQRVVQGVSDCLSQARHASEGASEHSDRQPSFALEGGAQSPPPYCGCRLLMLRLILSSLPPSMLMKPFDWEDDFTVMRAYTMLAGWRGRARYDRDERASVRRSSLMRIK